MRFSIKAKLSIILSLILVVAFLAINLLNYDVSRATLRRNIIQEVLPGISNNILFEIQSELVIPVQVSSLMANDTFLKDWVLDGEKDVSKITRYLWEIKEKYGFFSSFLVSTKTDNYYHYKGILKQIDPKDPHDVWFFDFLKEGEDYILDVDTDEATQGALTIFINHRLNDYQGNLIAVTGVGLNMRQVGGMLKSFRERYGKDVYLVNRQGLIQVHSDQNLIEKVDLHRMEGMEAIAPRILGATAESVVAEYDSDRGHMIVISRYVPEFDWFLVVEHQEERGMSEIRENFNRNLFIGFLVTILVIIINVLVVNFFQSKLEHLATTDELTGLPNRRSFLEQARREISQAARYGRPVSFLMIDADKFKNINDKHGHPVGDKILMETARILRDGLRSGDLAGRMGGEEFAVILPMTGPQEAVETAERLRLLVDALTVPIEQGFCRITISVGVSSFRNQGETLEELLKRADRALYQSKALGRNRVTLEE